jgi:thiol-disulfide isomerase/thioredoxin
MVVRSVDGAPVRSANELVTLIGGRLAGAQVVLEIEDPASTQLTVTLGERPSDLSRMAQRMRGTRPPSVTVQRIDGGSFDLAEPTGSLRLIEFWATWCGPCVASIPRLRALRASYTEGQLQMVSVSNEDESTVRRHLERHPRPWTVALDPDEASNEAWWVLSFPTFLLLAPSGDVVGVYNGLDGLTEAEAEIARSLSPAPGE